MVKDGLTGPKATAEQIATATVTVLKRTVPVAMPGIFFLSGETVVMTELVGDWSVMRVLMSRY